MMVIKNEFIYIAIYSLICLVLGYSLATFKVSTNEYRYISLCLYNNNALISDVDVIKDCKSSFEKFKAK